MVMYVRSFECSFFFSLKHRAPGSVVVQIICVIWGWCSEWFSQFLICVFLVFFLSHFVHLWLVLVPMLVLVLVPVMELMLLTMCSECVCVVMNGREFILCSYNINLQKKKTSCTTSIHHFLSLRLLFIVPFNCHICKMKCEYKSIRLSDIPKWLLAKKWEKIWRTTGLRKKALTAVEGIEAKNAKK